MYKRVILIGYKHGSKSVRALATKLKEELNNKPKVLRVRKNSPTYKQRPTHYMIRWGGTNPIATNKLDFFKIISKWNSDNQNYPDTHINIPDWTEDGEIAKSWESLVVCRKLLRSHSGNGIVMYQHGVDNELPKAPLYVKYKKKRHEYRVHVFKEKDNSYTIIDVTQKKKRKDFDGETNTQIRNHKNGWVYCRENITEPNDLRSQAILAATAINLTFGAVDLIWNEKENTSYVLEINTAPGIEGTTLQKYADVFIKDMKNATKAN